jgi:hypothetical protein
VVLKHRLARADICPVERKLIGFCGLVGGTVGSFLPSLWGGSSMGLGSILFALLGGVAGVFIGARIAGV